jgi:multidrug efflux pump subunit AcrA (membrane-fusion protein)
MLDLANLNLERTTIKAPFDGVIVSDLVEKGDYVRAGDEVITLEDTDHADVQCSLRVDQVQRILKYQVPDSRFETDQIIAAYQLPPVPVTVTSDAAGTDVRWEGLLTRFDSIGVDEQTRMVPCRVVVDDPVSTTAGRPVALVRNMFVDVIIGLSLHEDRGERLLAIPEIAIHPGGVVWTVEAGVLRRHNVTVVDRQGASGDRIAVVRSESEDLDAGSQIVITPLAQPNPGIEVRVVPAMAANSTAGQPATAEPDQPPTAGTSPATAPAAAPPVTGDEPAAIQGKGDSNRS